MAESIVTKNLLFQDQCIKRDVISEFRKQKKIIAKIYLCNHMEIIIIHYVSCPNSWQDFQMKLLNFESTTDDLNFLNC